MSLPITTATAPSLIAAGALAPAAAAPQTLLDLMYDGFYALFMLKNGNGPQDDAAFARKMTQFLDDFGRNARRRNAAPDDVDAAIYAFCAAVDEIILRSGFANAGRCNCSCSATSWPANTSSSGWNGCASAAARTWKRSRYSTCACCSASRAATFWRGRKS
jgi:hypothetical protein